MQAALLKETVLRKNYLMDQPVRSIYFGGGTPSLMETMEITELLALIRSHYLVEEDAEITLPCSLKYGSREWVL